MFLSFLLVGLAIISFLLAGLMVDFYLLKRCQKLDVNLPLFLGLGFGAVGLFQLVLSWWQLPLSQEVVLAVFLVLGLPLVLDTKLVRLIKQAVLKQAKRTTKSTRFFWLDLGIFIGLLALLTFSHTIWGSDAYVFWLAKASAFFQDGMVTKENLFVYWPYDHPLLWPLTAAWVYHFLGQVDEYYFQLIPLMLLGSLGLAFFQGLRELDWGRLFWTGLLLLTPLVYAQAAAAEYAGNADLLLSFYFLLATVSIFKKQWLYAGILLLFTVLTKNDSWPAVFGFVLLWPLVYKKTFKEKQKWIWIGLVAVLGLYWLGRSWLGLTNRYLLSLKSLGQKREVLASIWYTLNALREELRQISRWGIGWWVVIFGLIANLKRIFKEQQLKLILGILVVQTLSLPVIYFLTPEDQATHIATSLHRLVLQLYPASLYLVAQLSYNKGVYEDRH